MPTYALNLPALRLDRTLFPCWKERVMQFQVNAAGKKIYPSEFKSKVLSELRGGATPHELGRRYGVPIQKIVNWRKGAELTVLGQGANASNPEDAALMAEYEKALEEIKNLRRSLVNMTLDRDILKEAHDIAVKKSGSCPRSNSPGQIQTGSHLPSALRFSFEPIRESKASADALQAEG